MTDSMVSSGHYNALRLERDELAARVERLERVSIWAQNGFNDCDDWDRFVAFNCKVFEESAAQSMLIHDAELMESEAKVWLRDGNATSMYSGKNVNCVLSVRAREFRDEAEGKDR
jgi:hypothetical protein